MFDTTSFTLGSALAAAGTVTVSYPSGRSKGNYAISGGRHVLVVSGSNTYYAPDDFTLTFNANASNITLTWGSGKPTLASGTRVTLQMERHGQDDGRPNDPAAPLKMVDGRLWLVDLGSPNVDDANGVAESQSVSAAAAFDLDGALVVGGEAVFDVPRNVVAAWTTTSVLTITGKDEFGNTMIETSASGTSHTGKKAFKKVTSVTSSASITSASVGTGNVLGLPVCVSHASYILAELKDGAPLPRKANLVKLQGRVLCTDDTVGVVVSPVAGTITKIDTVEIAGGITTNDAVLTFRIGTTNITNGVVTVATSGSAAGVKDSASPTAANVLAVGDAITCVVSGTPGGSQSVEATFTVELSATEVLDGTFVAGITGTAQSGTAGDVRGTYAPADTPNGDLGWKLLAALPDPAFKGNTQFDG